MKSWIPLFALSLFSLLIVSGCGNSTPKPAGDPAQTAAGRDTTPTKPTVSLLPVDSAQYRARVNYMLNGDTSGLWPVQDPIPVAGAVLPFKRIIAYYGNLFSKQMGILGELPKDEMLAKLKQEMARWEKADPKTPVQPALHYIAVTAQLAPGKGNTYRLRMPHKEIDKVLAMAEEVNGLVFIDIQVGHSTLQQEIPELVEYLKKPNVHLGIDPEFSMKGGQRPGAAIGSFDAEDINFAATYLSDLVKQHNLPPKILVLHRFTQGGITNYRKIKLHPEVQIVMHMDGWGEPAKKFNTYKMHIHREPVQFTGFKIFYKNDVKHPPHRLLTPEELMQLQPMPLYIQYQ